MSHPDCQRFACKDECCSVGVDVWPHERQALIDDGLAESGDFTGPALDEEGDLLYRTALGNRGCVFLQPHRGCRLHRLGRKPETCVAVPRDAAEVARLVSLGMLPCYAESGEV